MSMVQSFDHEILGEFENFNKNNQQKVNTIYLQNYYYDVPLNKTIDELTSKDGQGAGSHFQINYVTKELVERMHAAGKIVIIWIDQTVPKEVYEENDDFYRKVYDLGVDMLTTDYPLRAQQVINKYHSKLINQKLMLL